MTFAKGRGVEGPFRSIQLPPRRECRRAIDNHHEGDKVEEAALKALKDLLRAAVALSKGQEPRRSQAIEQQAG